MNDFSWLCDQLHEEEVRQSNVKSKMSEIAALQKAHSESVEQERGVQYIKMSEVARLQAEHQRRHTAELAKALKDTLAECKANDRKMRAANELRKRQRLAEAKKEYRSKITEFRAHAKELASTGKLTGVQAGVLEHHLNRIGSSL